MLLEAVLLLLFFLVVLWLFLIIARTAFFDELFLYLLELPCHLMLMLVFLFAFLLIIIEMLNFLKMLSYKLIKLLFFIVKVSLLELTFVVELGFICFFLILLCIKLACFCVFVLSSNQVSLMLD